MVEPNEHDEDALYRRADQELDDGSRDMDVWQRACAMASRDHDEARFLYQTLRVEQWLAGESTVTRDSVLQSVSTPNGTPPNTRSADSELGPDEGEASRERSVSGPRSVDELEQRIETDSDPSTDSADSGSVAPRPDAPDERRADANLAPESNVADPDPPSDGPDSVEDLRDGIDIQSNGDESAASPTDDESLAVRRLASDDERNGSTAGLPGGATPETGRRRGTGSPVIRAARERRGRRYLVLRRGRSEFAAAAEGSSWPAALCTLPWLLWHGLVGTALSYALLWIVLIGGLLIVALTTVDRAEPLSIPLQVFVIGYALIALAGLLYVPLRHANGWYRRRLERDGFEPLRPVRAVDRRDAVEQVRRAQRA